MRVLLLFTLGEVAPVLRVLGMMVARLLTLGEAALVGVPRLLLAGGEIAFLFLALRVVLFSLLPGGKGALVPVLVIVRCGDAFGS